MNTILGLDIGSTALKIIALGTENELLPEMRFPSPVSREELSRSVSEYLSSARLAPDHIDRVAVTGVGASLLDAAFLDRPVSHISEFAATAAGGLFLSGKTRAIVVSMGTGTAFLYADKEKCETRHLGGSGIGGGTLCGLCGRLLGVSDFHEIERLAATGTLSAVDLTVGDVSKARIDNLNAELTAANFAKLSGQASPADLAVGVINLVLQGIGSMALFLSRSCETKDVVLTGSLSVLQQLQATYAFFNRMYDINFCIPPHSPYACAIGAALGAKSE